MQWRGGLSKQLSHHASCVAGALWVGAGLQAGAVLENEEAQATAPTPDQQAGKLLAMSATASASSGVSRSSASWPEVSGRGM